MNQKRYPKNRSSQRSNHRSTAPEKPVIQTRPFILESIKTTIDLGAYIVFDIETTGGNPERNGITDIFAIKYVNGQIVETFGTLVNPKIPIPPIVRRMTGITNAMVRNAPLIEDVMPQFVEFVGNSILVSHNTIGDMKFIRYFTEKTTGQEFDNFYLCTHLLVERLFPETPDKSLSGLVKYFGIESGDLHRAEADGYATLGLFEVLLEGLKRRNIEQLEEAIRFQGDMESALRLGWAVPQKIIESLPSRPGIFRFLDYENNEMFVCSAQNLQREVLKLRSSSQLPRQLLRMVLRTYHITFEETPSLFQAMLQECETANDHNSGALVHQRQVMAYTISKKDKGYQLAVDSIGTGAITAYGPVKDRRAASELLDKIAGIFGQTPSREGSNFSYHDVRLIRGFFEGNLGDIKNTLEKKSKGFSLLFQPTKKRRYIAEIKLVEKLQALDLSTKIQPLLNRNGLLAVKQEVQDRWDIYGIVRSRPVVCRPFIGPIDELGKSPLGTELWGQIKPEKGASASAFKQRKPSPLTNKEAKVANATLWWILNIRSDGRFFSSP